MGKFIPQILSWILKDVIAPMVNYLLDVIKIEAIKKQDQKAIEDLKNAKSDSDVDRAIDNLP